MSGTNFVGSKISLISKAGIRYLGTLVDINAAESTVALKDVMSFGTENRPCPTPYPPSKQPYSYIKFRGTDIADLHVFEQTQPQDPAIIEASQAPPNGHHIPSGPMPPGEMSPGPPGTGAGPGAGPVPGTFNASYSPNSSFNQAANNSGNFPNYPSQAAPTPSNSFAESGDAAKPSSPAPNKQISQEEKKEGDETEEYKGEAGNYRGRGRNNNQRKNSYNNNNRRSHREGMPFTNKVLSFDADFDFDASNAKFKKSEIVEEFAKKLSKMSLNEPEQQQQPQAQEPSNEDKQQDPEAPPVDDDQFYDRNKSFFDTISCEALEKEKGERRRPPSWHAERNLNSETFGEGVVSYHRRSYQNNYRGRSNMNGGGYGGGGYNQGYQQRYNNYNGQRNEHYYRGGHRSSGFRHGDTGYRDQQGRDSGYRRDYNNSTYREGGYNNRDMGYNNRDRRDYNDRNSYPPRRDNRDFNRDNRHRNNYIRNDEQGQGHRNSYNRVEEQGQGHRNNYNRGDEQGQGRASYRRTEQRGGRQQTQTEAT